MEMNSTRLYKYSFAAGFLATIVVAVGARILNAVASAAQE
jgi:hypothetical protein